MKRRWVIAVGILGTILVGGIAFVTFGRREPVYQDKPLSYWLDEINRAEGLENIAPALTAIRAMGTNALPFLLRHIEHEDPPLKSWLAKLARKRGSFRLQMLEPNPLRSPSLLAVRELGADAKPLIPDLVGLLESDARAWHAEFALWAIGPEATSAIEKTCQSTNEHVRATAGLLLARYRVGRPIDGWSCYWNRSPVSGRMLCGLLSNFPEQIVVALSRNLKHREAAVRRASAEALIRLGKAAKPAMSALMVALNDQDRDVGHAAAEALKAVDPEAAANAGVK